MGRARLAVAHLFLVVSTLALQGCSARSASSTPPTVIGPTLPPTSPPAEVPALLSTSTSAPCTNNAHFLDDLSLPDGSAVAPGAEMVKRWSIANEGTCDWGPGYSLRHTGGEGLMGPEAVALFPARAGSTAVWEVVLQAPEAPGEYHSEWQAEAPDGTLFGDVVFVIVVVEQEEAITPVDTAVP